MEDQIITNIIHSLVKLYGKKKIALIVDESEDSEPLRGLPNCPKGQIWNALLGKCVDDIG